MNPIEKARRDIAQLSKEYNVPISSVVWIGDNKYIVVKDGKSIWI